MSAVQEVPLDPGSASTQKEAGDPVVLGDASFRNLRHTLQRNNMERAICQRHTRHLDSQRRTIKSKLDREEKELRHQLQRLHEEQRVLSRLDSLQDEYLLHNVSRANRADETADDDVTPPGEPEVAVVNPYPVALRRQDYEEPPTPRSCRPPQYHARRRVSVEFEDLELQTSTGKMFPPLSGGSRSRAGRGTPPLALGLHTAVSMLSLVSPSSMALCQSTGGSPREKDAHFCWAGAPEAIHSVRRPRKTVARQRLDNLLVKSGNYTKSLQGRGGGAGGGSGGGGGGGGQKSEGPLGRSQSLKARGSTSSRATLHCSPSGVSRAGSWKEGRRSGPNTTTESGEVIDREALKAGLLQGKPGGGAEKGASTPRGVKGYRGHNKRHLLHRQSSSMSLREYARTPGVSETSLISLRDLRNCSVTSLQDVSLTIQPHQLQEAPSRSPSLLSLRDFTATPETKSCVWGTVPAATLEEGDANPPPGERSPTRVASVSSSSSLLHRRRQGKRQETSSLPTGGPTPQTGLDVASTDIGKSRVSTKSPALNK